MKCCVKNCNNDSNNHAYLCFYSFPKNKKAWLEALDLSIDYLSNNDYVCSQHFYESDFYWTNDDVKSLKSNAVPHVVCDFHLDMSIEDKACRLCLATNRKLYDIEQCSVDRELFDFIIGCEIFDLEKLPNKLCWECAHRMSAFNNFRNSSIKIQQALNNIVLENDCIKLKDIKPIKRLHKTLTCHVFNEDSNKNKYILDETDNIVMTIDNDIIINNNGISDEVKNEETALDSTKVEIVIKKEELLFEGEETCNFDGNAINSDSETGNSEVDLNVSDADSNKSDEDYENPSSSDYDSEDNEVLTNFKIKKDASVKKENIKAKKKNCIEKPKKKYARKCRRVKIDRRKTSKPLDEKMFTITTPSYEEQIEEVKKRAEHDRYKRAPLKCDLCFRGFEMRSRYNMHMEKHTEKYGEHECIVCKTRAKTHTALRKHLAGHKERICCNLCKFQTWNRGMATAHEKWHSGTLYKCQHCESTFEKPTTLLSHMRLKHPCAYVCELCGYTFLTTRGVDIHKWRKHTQQELKLPLDGPNCEECNVKFLTEKAYSRHLMLSSKHSNVEATTQIRNDSQYIHCPPSSKSSSNKQAKRERIKDEQNEDDEGEKCDGCSKRLKSYAALIRHLTVFPNHNKGQRTVRSVQMKKMMRGPITCEQCGIILKNSREYNSHFRDIHPGKNRSVFTHMKYPAMCEVCGRMFQSHAHLQEHKPVHDTEKQYKCDECAKCFSNKRMLLNHLKLHTEHQQMWSCDVCRKQFNKKANRDRHAMIHTGLRPFKCDMCDKCFKNRGDMKNHVAFVHMKKPWPKRNRTREKQGAESHKPIPLNYSEEMAQYKWQI